MVARVDFYYGLGSRYSYLAFTQLARIEREQRCRFELFPISSLELMHCLGRSPFEGTPVSGQYDWSYRQRDAEAWAELYGVPYVEPRRLPQDHRLMARACHAAARRGDIRAYTAAIFDAVFVSGAEVDWDICVATADALGLNRTKFEADLDDPQTDERVSALAREAAYRGAFGVPTFFLDGSMFWGNDRLVLLEAALRKCA